MKKALDSAPEMMLRVDLNAGKAEMPAVDLYHRSLAADPPDFRRASKSHDRGNLASSPSTVASRAPDGDDPMTVCTCDPRHLEIGGYDPGCPRHDTTRAAGDR